MSRPWKHPKTGIYWFRKAVPEDFLTAIGKCEEKFSLKTRDQVEAKRLHAEALATLEERWANLRAPRRKLDNSELHGISVWFYEHCLKLGELPDIAWDTKIGEDLWERKSTSIFHPMIPISIPNPGELPRYPRRILLSYERDELEFWCQEQAAEIISGKDWKVDEEDRLNVAKAVSVGAQRAALGLKRRIKGEFSLDCPDSVATRSTETSAKDKPRETVTFESLLQGWAAEKGPTAKTIYTWNRVLEQFVEFLDHKDANRLTPDDLLSWKVALLAGGVRTKTIRDSKIAPLRAILQWGVDSRKLSTNPASRIVVDARSKAIERIRGFTENEALQILRKASNELDPNKRWIPLLCAYSGAGIGSMPVTNRGYF